MNGHRQSRTRDIDVAVDEHFDDFLSLLLPIADHYDSVLAQKLIREFLSGATDRSSRRSHLPVVPSERDAESRGQGLDWVRQRVAAGLVPRKHNANNRIAAVKYQAARVARHRERSGVTDYA